MSAIKPMPKSSREIDWKSIHERIAARKSALDILGTVSDEERERIWTERAREFARVPENESSGYVEHLVIFHLGRELCAFDVVYVESIRPLEKVTTIPRTPNWVVGVSNLRGQIYSVTDLQKFLHLNNGNETSSHEGEILLIKSDSIRFAMRVDKVYSVEMIAGSRIRPSSDTIHGVKPEFVRGVIEDYEFNNAKIPVLVLNMDAVVSDESLIVHEEFS